MNEQVAQKNEDNMQCVAKSLQSFSFQSENNISIDLNHSNNCCLYSLKSEDLILLYPFYLHFSMLLFPSILTGKSLNTMYVLNKFLSD